MPIEATTLALWIYLTLEKNGNNIAGTNLIQDIVCNYLLPLVRQQLAHKTAAADSVVGEHATEN
jgi:hypothetical protein